VSRERVRNHQSHSFLQRLSRKGAATSGMSGGPFCSSFYVPAVFAQAFSKGLLSKSLNALVALFKLLCAGAFLLKLFLKA
jgi:hypothetical protein